MVRLLTLVVAVWLVSLESCYGFGGDEMCTLWPNITYDFKEYDYNVEECNSFYFDNVDQLFFSSHFSVKLYDSNCSDESFIFLDIKNETHMGYNFKTYENQNFSSGSGVFNIYNDSYYEFFIYLWLETRLACFSTYVNQVSMSERCSIEAPDGWDFLNFTNPTWQSFYNLYNRIDCNCTWGCNITSALPPESEEKDESFPLWAILVISIGGAIILGMAAYFLVKKGKANIGVQVERVTKEFLIF